MTTILECSIDSEDFALGRALNVEPDVSITLEEVIPTGNRAMPYFWVSGADLEEFESAVEQDPSVEAIRRHLKLQESALFYAQWAEGVTSLLYSIAESEGSIMDGVGSRGRWQFTLRFPDRDSLSAFRRRCEDQDIKLDVHRIYSVSSDQFDMAYGLTSKQRDALTTALDMGYFNIPREASQQDLAAELGVQSSAVSETLRRATAELIANTLLEARMHPDNGGA
jgi:predicted DNA binding protein